MLGHTIVSQEMIWLDTLMDRKTQGSRAFENREFILGTSTSSFEDAKLNHRN